MAKRKGLLPVPGMDRRLAVVSDIHAGSTVAVCAGPVELDDGQTVQPSEAQRWLADLWEEYWAWIAANRGDWLGVLVNGDLFDGDHHGTFQLMSRHPGAQGAIARRLFEPIFDLKPDAVFFVRGTESHVGQSGASEEGFAKQCAEAGLPVVQDPTGGYSWWHFRGRFGATLVDAAHHGRIGGREWTKHNAVANQAADIMLSHAQSGDPIPDLVIRSHLHTHSDSGHNYRCRVVQTPAFQLKTGFAHKVVADKVADIGGLLVTLPDTGLATVEARITRPTRSPAWHAP